VHKGSAISLARTFLEGLLLPAPKCTVQEKKTTQAVEHARIN